MSFAPLENPGIDDLLDDLGEHTLKTAGDVVIVRASACRPIPVSLRSTDISALGPASEGRTALLSANGEAR